MITTFVCEETDSTSLKIQKQDDSLLLTTDGSMIEKTEVYIKLENLHFLIGHLLKIQKQIREEGQNG